MTQKSINFQILLSFILLVFVLIFFQVTDVDIYVQELFSILIIRLGYGIDKNQLVSFYYILD